MYKSSIAITLAATLAFVVLHSYADATNIVQTDMGQKAPLQGHQGRGIVNKINLDAGKINISHEAITSLKWPKMTMDFNVQDKSALTEVKPGMKVDFELEKFADGYRITRIAPAKE